MGVKNNCGGQAGVEYLIIIGFVTFAITATLALSYFYVGISQDSIKMNQIEVFADKVINSAEAVYYSGEPSKTTINVYLPIGVEEVRLDNKNLIITFSSSSGTVVRAFPSNVPIEGTISPSHGSRRIIIEAKSDYVRVEKA